MKDFMDELDMELEGDMSGITPKQTQNKQEAQTPNTKNTQDTKAAQISKTQAERKPEIAKAMPVKSQQKKTQGERKPHQNNNSAQNNKNKRPNQ